MILTACDFDTLEQNVFNSSYIFSIHVFSIRPISTSLQVRLSPGEHQVTYPLAN